MGYDGRPMIFKGSKQHRSPPHPIPTTASPIFLSIVTSPLFSLSRGEALFVPPLAISSLLIGAKSLHHPLAIFYYFVITKKLNPGN